jgi:large subunit ribosomal protein L7Ae
METLLQDLELATTELLAMLKPATKLSKGILETLRALERGHVKFVVIAQDVEASQLLAPIIREAERKNIKIYLVENKKALAQACGVETIASAVALRK